MSFFYFFWIFLGITLFFIFLGAIAKTVQVRRGRALQQPNMVMVSSQPGVTAPVAVIMPTHRPPGQHEVQHPPVMGHQMGQSMHQSMGPSMHQSMGPSMHHSMGPSMNQSHPQGAPTAPPTYDESNGQYPNQGYPNKNANVY